MEVEGKLHQWAALRVDLARGDLPALNRFPDRSVADGRHERSTLAAATAADVLLDIDTVVGADSVPEEVERLFNLFRPEEWRELVNLAYLEQLFVQDVVTAPNWAHLLAPPPTRHV